MPLRIDNLIDQAGTVNISHLGRFYNNHLIIFGLQPHQLQHLSMTKLNT